MMTLDEYRLDLESEIGASAVASEQFKAESFTQIAASRLQEAEELADFTLASISGSGKSRKKYGLDGFSYDMADESFTCLIADYFEGDEIASLTKTDVESYSSQVLHFLEIASDYDLMAGLQGTAFEVAQEIHFSVRNASRIRIILLSSRLLSDRVKTVDSKILGLLRVDIEVWDLARFYGLYTSGQGKEETQIDFTQWLPDGLPALKVPSGEEENLEIYLAVIPGKILASVYDIYGSRLLEGNVRSFLSAKGKVNKGIRATLLQDPAKFLAYNNGLSTTATGVITSGQGPVQNIKQITNLQIVNGGQTTASLYAFMRGEPLKSQNLEDVSVQLKLIVLPQDEAEVMVPDIARFANTQNSVQDSDFFSNSPFHVRIEDISRRLNAGPKSGMVTTSRWFYERARGSYLNEKGKHSTLTEQRKFELTYPRSQVISKTDLAIYQNVWSQKPHLVSRGAQKNFAEFAKETASAYSTETGKAMFEDEYFKQMVVKAIVYKSLRTAVLKAEWYEKGYLANIVAYAIAILAHTLESKGLDLNWQRLWRSQEVSESLLQNLLEASRIALQVLTDENRPQKNISEWAKSEQCWALARTQPLALSQDLKGELVVVSIDEIKDEKKQRMESGKLLTEIEKLNFLSSFPIDLWDAIVQSTRISLSPKERDILKILRSRNVLTVAQADVMLRLIARAKSEGVIPQ